MTDDKTAKTTHEDEHPLNSKVNWRVRTFPNGVRSFQVSFNNGRTWIEERVLNDDDPIPPCDVTRYV